MKMNQTQVWDNIAEEWYVFKDKPAEHSIEFLKKQKGKILDLGSGAGRNLTKIKNGKMYLVDFSEQMINFAKKRAKQKNIKAKFFVLNATKLPFPDNYFDSAIVIALIHCIEGEKNREKTIKELFRVLKPEAEAKIAVWNKNSRRFKNSPKEKYVRWRDKGKRYYYLFNEEEIYDLFERHGFKIKKKLEHKVNIDFIVKKSL